MGTQREDAFSVMKRVEPMVCWKDEKKVYIAAFLQGMVY